MNKVIQYIIYFIIVVLVILGFYFLNITFLPDFLAPFKNFFMVDKIQKDLDVEIGNKFNKTETAFDKFKQSKIGITILIIIAVFLIYKFGKFLTYAGFPILGSSYFSVGSSYWIPNLNKRFFIDSEISKYDVPNFENLIFFNQKNDAKKDNTSNTIVSSWYQKIFVKIGQIIQSVLSTCWLFATGWFGTFAISFEKNQDLLFLDKEVFWEKYLKNPENPLDTEVKLGWRRPWKFILWLTTLGMDRELFKQIRPYENTLMSFKRLSMGLFKYWIYISIFMIGIMKYPLVYAFNSDPMTMIFSNINTIFYLTLIIIISIIAFRQVRSLWLPGNQINIKAIDETPLPQPEQSQIVQTGGADEEVIQEIKYGKKKSIKNNIVKNAFTYEQLDCNSYEPILIQEIKKLENIETIENYSCDSNQSNYYYNNVIKQFVQKGDQVVIENTSFDQKLIEKTQEQLQKIAKSQLSSSTQPAPEQLKPVQASAPESVTTPVTAHESVIATESVTTPVTAHESVIATESVTTPVTAPESAAPGQAPTPEPVTDPTANPVQQTGGNIEDFDVKKVKKMKIPKIENFEHIFYDKNGDPIYVDVEGFLHKITDFRIQNKKKKVILN